MAVPDGALDRTALDTVAGRFHAEHRALYGYDFSGDADQQVEWVNLRVSGIGPIQRPEIRTGGGAPLVEEVAQRPSRNHGPDRSASTPTTGTSTRRCAGDPTSRPGTVLDGPVIIEEFGSTVPVHPGFTVRVDDYRNLIVTRQEAVHEPQGAHPVPLRQPDRRRRRGRRPGAGRDRAGLAGQRRDGGRDRHRAHQPQPDDPRRPRLPRRHPRPAAAQAHRPVLLRARAPGRPRLPDRGDARGRRLLPQRRLPLRGRHRPPARPVRDGAGVQRSRRASAGSWRSCRPSATTTTSAERCPGSMPEPRHQRLRGGADGPADPALGRRRAQPGRAGDHDPQLPDARVARRRPRRRVLGLPDGRAPARRAVRPVRRRDRRVVLRRDHRPHHDDVPPRDPLEDPGRHLDVGGLRRARRRRRAEAAHPAHHADPHTRPTTPTASG